MLVGLTVRVVIGYVGIDKLTTVDTLKPATLAVSSAFAIITAVFVAVAWFTLRDDVLVRTEQSHLWKLKKDRVGVWWLGGIAWMVINALAAAWLSATFLGVLAQYLPGKLESVRGVVEYNREVGTPSTSCRRRLGVRDHSRRTLIRVCLYKLVNGGIGPANLVAGETVTMTVVDTVFARVIKQVQRGSPAQME
jgi:hypothetical protein